MLSSINPLMQLPCSCWWYLPRGFVLAIPIFWFICQSRNVICSSLLEVNVVFLSLVQIRRLVPAECGARMTSHQGASPDKGTALSSNGHVPRRQDDSILSKVVFKDKEISFSVDLVDAARKQLVFLKEVDNCPYLYEGPLVKNAVRRYEEYWLPLIADYKGKDIAPPLDVHWIWHVHMLAPYHYQKDCQNLINTVPCHKLRSEGYRQSAMKSCRSLWEERYKNEPFDVTLDKLMQSKEAAECSYQSKCSYDIEAAVGRQRMFYYQVSLPHYKDSAFLKDALLRYKKYLFLKKTYPDMFLVPCYDFDLIWHSHQLHPSLYEKDTTAILGKMFNHDDSVNDRSANSKLSRCDVKTRDVWRQTFHEDFNRNGCMFRGEPPYGKLASISHDQVFSVSSKKAEVTINQIKIENLSQEDQKFTLKVSLAGRQQSGSTLFKLKGPQKEWDNSGRGITKFTFDTGHHSLLQFDLMDKKGFLCFCSNQSFGIHNYPFSQVVEGTPSDGQTVSQTLPLLEGGSGPNNGLSVTFTASVNPPERGPCILMLQPGPFQPYTIPESIEQLWGPIPLPRLPDGVPNTCIVASHR